jgi:hypothetical protein
MTARHCPPFAVSTALSRPSLGFLASSGWHFSMPRKQAGVSHLRSDYPMIFMSFRTLLLGRCRWLNSDVVSPFGPSWLRQQRSRRLGFHPPNQVHDHGCISAVAPDCHRRCGRSRHGTHHRYSKLPSVPLSLSPTAVRDLLLVSNVHTRPSCAVFVCQLATGTDLHQSVRPHAAREPFVKNQTRSRSITPAFLTAPVIGRQRCKAWSKDHTSTWTERN